MAAVERHMNLFTTIFWQWNLHFLLTFYWKIVRTLLVVSEIIEWNGLYIYIRSINHPPEIRCWSVVRVTPFLQKLSSHI